MKKKGRPGTATPFTAVFGGVEITTGYQTWARILEVPPSLVERELKHHYSMQAVIDERFSMVSRIRELSRKFCCGRSKL